MSGPHPEAAALRLGVFLVLLVLLVLAEWRWPRHRACPQRGRRWPVNLGLAVVDTLLLRLSGPLLALAVAIEAQARGIGVWHLVHAPAWVAVSASVVLLDLTIYGQHRLMHRVPWLWRLHRMHHTDLALDVTSGMRFHPLEILFSMGVKSAAVLVLGAPPLAVLVFEVLLNGFSLFTHANLALPARIERVLRWGVVTPDMHRIHHSVRADEHHRNFGFSVSWWDRLFGSYRRTPREPQASLRLGLEHFREAREQGLLALLLQPFRTPGA